MKARELLVRAVNTLSGASSKIESKVLSQSTKLRPETMSIASRLYELINYIEEMLKKIIDKTSEELEGDAVLELGKRFYIVFHRNRFIIVRSKPYYIVVSYNGDNNELYVKTRKFSAKITPDTFEAVLMNVRVEINIGNVDDYVDKYNELKYVMKTFGRIIEYNLAPLAEKRIELLK